MLEDARSGLKLAFDRVPWSEETVGDRLGTGVRYRIPEDEDPDEDDDDEDEDSEDDDDEDEDSEDDSLRRGFLRGRLRRR